MESVEIVLQADCQDANLDVVFMHGLNRKAEHTWCGQERSELWLKTFLPLDFETLGFKASLITCGLNIFDVLTGAMTFGELSKQVFQQLQDYRTKRCGTQNVRPAIFVCHSLGGMLVRQALMQAEFAELRKLTKGLIFFGTPNYKTDHEWSEFIQSIELARTLKRQQEEQSLPSSLIQGLTKTNEEFFRWLSLRKMPRQDICSFYETLPVYRVGIIAPQHAVAIPHYPNHAQSCNHLGLARFDSAYDWAYQKFVDQLQKLRDKPPPVSHSWTATLELAAPGSYGTNETPDGREIIQADNLESTKEARRTCRIALALEDRGQLNLAGQRYRDAYEKYCSIEGIGKDHSLSLFCLDKQGSVKRDLSEYVDAEKIGEEVYHAQVRTKDVGFLRGAGNFARTLRARGKYEEAFNIMKGALMATDGCPFYTKPGTTAVSILAKILKDQGRYKFAEHLSRDVVRACYVNFGRMHPFTLNRESDLAVVIAKRGRFETAVKVSAQALFGLRKVLGTTHPLTLRTAKRHATYLRFCRLTEEPQLVLEQTLDIQRKILDERHLDVLSTKSSLAAIYAITNQAEKAKEMYTVILKERKREFGVNNASRASNSSVAKPVHPDLLWTEEALSHVEEIVEIGWESMDENLREKHREFFQMPTLNKAADQKKFDDLRAHPIPLSPEEEKALAVLEKGATTPQDKDLNVALRIAAGRGEKELVKLALKNGADVSTTGGYYGSPLQAASFYGDEEIVNLLLQNGAPRGKSRVGLFGFALRAAAMGGHANVAKTLLDNLPENEVKEQANAKDDLLGTSIEAAMAGFHDSVVQVLLDKGANPNAQDPSLGTPLQQASWAGNEKLVAMLLQRGANPTLKSGAIGSALQLAASEDLDKHRNIMRLLLKEGAASEGDSYAEALEAAVHHGFVENVKILLNEGSDKRMQTYINALQAITPSHRTELADMLRNHEPMPGRGTVANHLPLLGTFVAPDSQDQDDDATSQTRRSQLYGSRPVSEYSAGNMSTDSVQSVTSPTSFPSIIDDVDKENLPVEPKSQSASPKPLPAHDTSMLSGTRTSERSKVVSDGQKKGRRMSLRRSLKPLSMLGRR